MRIRALRLREVGPFRDGVQLDGLDNGLNLFAGPNEAGKSTLFRALTTVFAERYKTTSTPLRLALQPYGGGAPLIEADFEIGTAAWRLRKQFVSGRSALLTRLDGGETHRNEDAESRLDTLLGVDCTERLGLLWVGQTKALDLPRTEAETGSLLRRTIEREIAHAVAGDAAEAVEQKVQVRLAELISLARELPRGDYKAAIESRARFERERAELRDKAAKASQRIEALGALRVRHARLDATSAIMARKKAIEAALAAVQEGIAARERKLAAESELTRLERELDRLIHERERLDELARIDADVGLARQDLTAAEGRSAGASADLAAARAARTAFEARERDLRRGLEQARCLESEQQMIAGISAQLAAASPRVGIHYAAGARGTIAIAGNPIEDDAELTVETPIVLTIAGVGQLHVAPGAHESDEVLRDEVTRRSAVVAKLTAEAGAALESGVLQRELDEHTSYGPATREAHDAAMAELSDARANSDRLRASIDTGERRRAELLRLAPAADPVAGAPAAIEVRRVDVEVAVQEARRTLDAWRATAPSDTDMRAREQHLSAAEERERHAVRDRFQIEREIATLEALLARDAEDGIGELLASVEDSYLAAEARVAAIDNEIAELRLIVRTFEEVRSANRDRYLAPVLARLGPTLDRLLPGATAELSAGFTMERIARGGTVEALDRLSTGTKEQIAVLVRLGFARLFADEGRPFPVVLDDALVYSDDERLRRMSGVLEDAAQHHQVILFSCHPSAFADLVAVRRSLTPWTP